MLVLVLMLMQMRMLVLMVVQLLPQVGRRRNGAEPAPVQKPIVQLAPQHIRLVGNFRGEERLGREGQRSRARLRRGTSGR